MDKGKDLKQLTEEQVKDWFSMIERTTKGKKKVKKNPVITISREWGSGGSRIAGIVQKKLGKPWRIWDKEILEEMERLSEVDLEMIKSLDEKSKSRFENFLENILTGESKFFGIDDYKRHLIRILLRIGHYGYAIILGRGANFVLPNSFRVRVVASRKKRVEAMRKYEEVSEEEALYLMRESDRERAEFAQKYFGENINDPWNYDLCIKTSHISVEKAAEIIISCAKEKLKF